jgi:hypothetical protein
MSCTVCRSLSMLLVIPPNYRLHRRWQFNEGALYLQKIQILRLPLRCKLGIVSHSLLRYKGPSHIYLEVKGTIIHSLEGMRYHEHRCLLQQGGFWNTNNQTVEVSYRSIKVTQLTKRDVFNYLLTWRYEVPCYTHFEVWGTILHSIGGMRDYLTLT